MAAPNLLAGVMAARERRAARSFLGITGAGEKRPAGLCDASVIAPSAVTSRIQEASLTIAHLWCEIVDTCLNDAREPCPPL